MKQLELQQKLGERIEALSNANLDDDSFAKEIERSEAMARLAKELVKSANVVLNAKKAVGMLTADIVDKIV